MSVFALCLLHSEGLFFPVNFFIQNYSQKCSPFGSEKEMGTY